MQTAFLSLACVAALGLVACQPTDPGAQGTAPAAGTAADTAPPWVKAPGLGTAGSAVKLEFELPKAPQTGDVAAVRLRWQASQPQPASRWKLHTEGTLERGAAPDELAVPVLAPGQPYEVTLQLRAVAAGFGELHLQPSGDGAAGGWAIPVWVAPRP